MKQSQCEKILDYMDRFGSITTLEAFNDIGCTRLASRICDLRQRGYAIADKLEKRKNRFGVTVHYKRYYMPKEGEIR
mgnify:CR=1 FL=1